MTTDTVLLAASVAVPPGSTVVELGCGAGGALLTAARHNPGCLWIGLDIRPELLREARDASLRTPPPRDPMHWVLCPVERVPAAFRGGVADLVVANPPYAPVESSRPSPDEERRIARSSAPLLLHGFLRAAAHLLRSGGRLVLVNRPASLCAVLLGCGAAGIRPERLQPVGDPDTPAELVLLSGTKGAAGPLILLPQRGAETFRGAAADSAPPG